MGYPSTRSGGLDLQNPAAYIMAEWDKMTANSFWLQGLWINEDLKRQRESLCSWGVLCHMRNRKHVHMQKKQSQGGLNDLQIILS